MMNSSFLQRLFYSLTILAFLSYAQDEQQNNNNNNKKLVRVGGRKQQRRSLFICLGIFRKCEDEDEDKDDVDGDGDEEEDKDDDPWCLGIFRDCDKDDDDEETTSEFDIFSPNSNNNDYSKCRESTDGLFGGRPIFGECGALTEIVDNLFNATDVDGDGEIDEISIGNIFSADSSTTSTNKTSADNNTPFDGLGVFPEGSLLYNIFNRDEDENLIETVLKDFRGTTNQITNGFLEDWAGSANTTDTVCNNTVESPDCLDLLGGDGFWACRTLTNPFNGIPSSRSVCLGEGEFLESNDVCGCCAEEGCPKTCDCPCKLDDDDDDDGTTSGVWVSTKLLGDIAIETCVDTRWAVTMTSRLSGISCVEECPER